MNAIVKLNTDIETLIGKRKYATPAQRYRITGQIRKLRARRDAIVLQLAATR